MSARSCVTAMSDAEVAPFFASDKNERTEHERTLLDVRFLIVDSMNVTIMISEAPIKPRLGTGKPLETLNLIAGGIVTEDSIAAARIPPHWKRSFLAWRKLKAGTSLLPSVNSNPRLSSSPMSPPFAFTPPDLPKVLENKFKLLLVHFDGAAPGNGSLNTSSNAGSGFIIRDERGYVIYRGSATLPPGATNNQAEYDAFLSAIKVALFFLQPEGVLKVFGDSQLLIEQVSGTAAIRALSLKPIALEARRSWAEL